MIIVTIIDIGSWFYLLFIIVHCHVTIIVIVITILLGPIPIKIFIAMLFLPEGIPQAESNIQTDTKVIEPFTFSMILHDLTFLSFFMGAHM